jgi:hypothetical protein
MDLTATNPERHASACSCRLPPRWRRSHSASARPGIDHHATNLLAESAAGTHAVCSQDGDWTLLNDEGGILLFNVRTDPGERDVLAARYPDIVRKLAQFHEAWRKEVGVIPPSPEKQARERALPRAGHAYREHKPQKLAPSAQRFVVTRNCASAMMDSSTGIAEFR